jgi:ketol-acid reductoisomerase
MSRKGFSMDGENTFKMHDESSGANLQALAKKTVAILGYGNQGRAQALCLRDSGMHVIVGNRDDDYRAAAVADGFAPVDILTAAQQGDVLMVLTSDESQAAIWDAQILPGIKAGNTLVWASGYNVAYDLLKIPAGVDAVMVAPRMMGSIVRDLYLEGRGAMAEVGVHLDASGSAMATALALCKAIGLLRGGCIESSFKGEAALDLFAEQVYMPVMTHWVEMCFDLGVKLGFAPEKMVLELYASTEMSKIFELMAKRGCYKQMSHHSTTSQYGTFSRAARYFTPEVEKHFCEVATRTFELDISGGAFVDEWSYGGREVEERLRALLAEKLSCPMSKAEDAVLALTGRHAQPVREERRPWFTWPAFALGVAAGAAAVMIAKRS